MTLLEPESRALLEEVLPRYTPAPGMPAAEARRMALELGRRLQGAAEDMAEIRDLMVPGGGHRVPIRLYRPAGCDGGWMLWIHGGGFMTGGLDTHDLLCRRLAAGSGQAVVSIDYRLAPDHPYPAAVEDCLAAFDWLVDQAGALALDGARSAIGGSSAGGNLAAALSLRLRDRAAPQPRCQVLVYPCVDATMALSAASAHGEGYQLTAAMMAYYLDAYCGPAQRRDPGLSPLFADSLSDLPPALVIIAELDPLAEEGLAYAERLRAEGGDTELLVVGGVMHGFFAQAGVLRRAREAQARACAFLRERLAM